MGKWILGIAVLTICGWGQTAETATMKVAAHISDIEPEDFINIRGAEGRATALLKQLGVQLDWAKRCSSCESIEIQMHRDAPADLPKQAMAYALPFAKDPDKRIRIFTSRLPRVYGMPREIILGYVIAHEIGHVLEQRDYHSDQGVMKACWNHADYRAMQYGRLFFTDEDQEWIRQHFRTDRRWNAGGVTSSSR